MTPKSRYRERSVMESVSRLCLVADARTRENDAPAKKNLRNYCNVGALTVCVSDSSGTLPFASRRQQTSARARVSPRCSARRAARSSPPTRRTPTRPSRRPRPSPCREPADPCPLVRTRKPPRTRLRISPRRRWVSPRRWRSAARSRPRRPRRTGSPRRRRGTPRGRSWRPWTARASS